MPTIDECIEKAESQLVNPKLYSVSGNYFFHAKYNDFTGEFKIDNNKRVVGFIKDTDNSVCPKHAVEGKIETQDNKTILRFVKMPGGMLVDIFYALFKEGTEIAGSYKGQWSFQELVIKLDEYKFENETQNITALSLEPLI